MLVAGFFVMRGRLVEQPAGDALGLQKRHLVDHLVVLYFLFLLLLIEIEIGIGGKGRSKRSTRRPADRWNQRQNTTGSRPAAQRPVAQPRRQAMPARRWNFRRT